MIFLELFCSFAFVGLFTIGGGYVALPLIQKEVVTARGWITVAEFADLVTISEITPGPISINAATYIGTKIAGVPGALAATAGFMLCPFIIVSVLFFLYRRYYDLAITQGIFKGLRPAVVALIASAGLSILTLSLWEDGGFSLSGIHWLSLALLTASFVVMRRFRPNPIFVILGCGLIGVLAQLAADYIF